MIRPIESLRQSEAILTAGMVATAIGIVLFCLGQAYASNDELIFLTPGTGGGVMATGVLIWLKGAVAHSLDL